MPLAKKRRLSGAEVRAVIKSGRRATSPFLDVNYRFNDSGSTRCAVLVPLSISKYATVRNRLRRILSEAIMRHWDAVPASYDILFKVKQLPSSADRFWAESAFQQAIAAMKRQI